MKKVLSIFFVLIFSKFAFGKELSSTLRVGYNNNGGVEIQYLADDDRFASSIPGWENIDLKHLYLVYFSQNSYLIGGLGYGIKYGYNSFLNKIQKYDLAEGTKRSSSLKSWNSIADLGTRTEGQVLYAVPNLYYHFFRKFPVSLLIGFGIGLQYSKVNGDMYITDQFEESTVDLSACSNYLKQNENKEDVGLYCEKLNIDYEGISTAYLMNINILGENIGFEFGWVGADTRYANGRLVMAVPSMSLFYIFDF